MGAAPFDSRLLTGKQAKVMQVGFVGNERQASF
jgi:hypothetical protein